jgi:replicative DNA helicase
MGLFLDVLHSHDLRLSEDGRPAWPDVPHLVTAAAVDTACAWLGAVRLDPDRTCLVVAVLPAISHVWCAHDAHNLIDDAMLTLSERHTVIDLQTLTDILHRRGQLEKVGGSIYLADLMEAAVTTANTVHHARIVRDKQVYRSLINVATDLSASAYQQEDIADILGRINNALLGISTSHTAPSFIDMHSLMHETIVQAQRFEGQGPTGVHSGFHYLDSHTGGFQNGHLIIVAARPSQGKSALATQFAQAASYALGGLPVPIFSLEMSKEELGARMLCSEARVDSMRMKRGLLAGQEWGQLMEAGDRLSELQVLIDDTPSVSVMDIRTRTKRLQMQRGLGVVVITAPQKRCSRCKSPKPLTEFSKDRRRKDGRASQCKRCDAQRLKTYYDTVCAPSEAFRQRNNAKVKAYYKKNKEHVRRYKAAYYQAHKAEITRQHQAYYASHKPAITLAQKRYHERHPGRSAEDRHRRRMRERQGLYTPITPALRQFMLHKQSNKCCYCRRRFTKAHRATVDHLTPIARGGSHTPDNIVYACKSCNSKKHVGPPPCPVQPFLPLAM